MPKKLLCIVMVLMTVMALIPAQALAYDEMQNTDPNRYYIILDTNHQVITVYERDDNGEYTRIVRQMVCTSGKTEAAGPDEPASPTPSGTWKIGARERFGKFAAFGGEYARYWTQIVGGIYFHSIMFGSREVDSLKSGPYKKLGSRASHGCVRLYVEDAKWFYYNACQGTTVKIVNGGHGSPALNRELKSKLSFDDYDAFQQTIFDNEPLSNLKAWIVTDDASMRTGNGTNDKFIRRLKEGMEVEVLQQGDPWVKILVDGREGYCKRAYITYEKGVMQSRPDGYYTPSTAYLFAEPDKKAERLYTMARDTSLKVLAIGPDFMLVDYFGTVGFVSKRNVKPGWATIYDD